MTIRSYKNPKEHKMETDSIESALEAIAKGRMVVVVDGVDRENEGDIIMAAEAPTEQDIAFMVRTME